jgi:hypothetical protein
MSDLKQLQRWMQAVITNLEGVRTGVASPEARTVIDVSPEEVERVVTRSKALSGLERLEIYHRAYYARLIECLREEYPVLLHALGDEAFDAFAVAYLQKYPSRSYTLNRLGDYFRQYLSETRPESEMGEKVSPIDWPAFLIDLVTLEMTYNEIFDGPGVEGNELLNLDQVLAITAERWPEARLEPVCCLRLLQLSYPVHRYYAAVRKKKEARLPKPSTTHLAITRRQFVVRRYELTRLQYRLLDALVRGATLGEAIRGVTERGGPGLDRLAQNLRQWFRNWTAEGFFQAVR